MSVDKTYFIPIDSNSLAHYFGRAIILPSKYYSNKKSDIQDNYKDSILLSLRKWVLLADCSLEVVLTEKESESLSALSDSFFKCHFPIPISRVVSVYFLNSEQGKITQWNINAGAAFIPNRIMKFESAANVDFHSGLESGNLPGGEESQDMSRKIKYFDHILGGLAFMRLGGDSLMNYSENYFSTLSYFSKRITDELKNAELETGIKDPGKYFGIFVRSNNIWEKYQAFL